jgi:hypothetical protein
MQARTAEAVIREATSRGVVACPVFTNKGAVDEVHLFNGSAMAASIFVPETGRIGIWRNDADQVTANTPAEAVRRALHPRQEHTREASPNPPKWPQSVRDNESRSRLTPEALLDPRATPRP